jgi:hypothetical protein
MAKFHYTECGQIIANYSIVPKHVQKHVKEREKQKRSTKLIKFGIYPN